MTALRIDSARVDHGQKERSLMETDPDIQSTGKVRLHGFALISGLGWLMDFGLFTILAHNGLDLFIANILGATAAVAFVFVTARRLIFRNLKRPLAAAIAAYVLWNFVAILLASAAIDSLAALLLSSGILSGMVVSASSGWFTLAQIVPPAAKILVTPLTMYSNYVAMGVIIERRFSFI
ncbi:MAG TPA: GtrA family protein [Allosphingosinicella sp.]|jgi:putative flippase GtrA